MPLLEVTELTRPIQLGLSNLVKHFLYKIPSINIIETLSGYQQEKVVTDKAILIHIHICKKKKKVSEEITNKFNQSTVKVNSR